MGVVVVGDPKDVGVALNRLAREQLKLKLMQDIRIDIAVCKLESIDYKDYLLELKSIIDGFIDAGTNLAPQDII